MKSRSAKNKESDSRRKRANNSDKKSSGKTTQQKKKSDIKNINSDSLSFMFMNFPDILWIFDNHLQIIFCTGEIKKIPGINLNKLTGKYVEETLLGSDKKFIRSMKNSPAITSSGKNYISDRFIHSIKNKNRKTLQVETTITAAGEPKKKHEIFAAVTRIIEKKSHSEKIPDETNLSMTLAKQLIHLGTYQFDKSGKNNHCSDEVFKIFERSADEGCFSLEGLYRVVHPDDKSFVIKSITNAFQKKTQFDFEFRIVTSEGKIKYLHNIGQVLRSEKKSSLRIFGIVLDITDRKTNDEKLGKYLFELKRNKELLEDKALELSSLNEQLKSATEELRRTNDAKDKFFSILAHDLRSPFHGLLGFSNMLVAEFDNLSDTEKKNMAERINLSAHYMFKLIENLLEWSRLQSGRMEINPIKTELREVVLYSINLLSNSAVAKQIVIVNNVPENIIAFADTNMLNSVLENLLSNAIKFSKRNSEVIINTTMLNNFVEISVNDSGVGIKKSDIEKLFKIDSHHSTTGTEEERGTGLGLIICKEMIEKLGGSLKVASRENEGSTFSFTIPLAGSIS
ncbi:MAG: PAS domain-containing protein [Ignavibacteriales bacterium]|nr:MAG: PAS domain-containing protein [Ignavibacteriales bacterium]